MSEKPNERTADRKPYEGPVWLKPEAGSSLVGDVRNVSRGGMFVNVVPTPPVGEEVLCELPGYRAVRGRVVWISSPADFAAHGVGIEFVDLTDKPTPILAMPSATYAGIDLQGPLDFLEEGAEIHLAAPNGHRQLRARVADVVLDHAGGATHLALSLVISPPIPRAVRDADEAWFPDITIDAPRIATPIAADVEAPVEPVAPAPAPRDTRLDDTVALLPGSVDDTERTLLAVALPYPAPRTRVLMPLAAVAGVILLALAILHVGFPAAEPAAPLPVAPLPARVEATPDPAAAVWTKTAPEPQAIPAQHATAAPMEPSVIAPVHVASATDPASWKPEVTSSKGEPSVLVPLKGSMKGMTSFVLDQPHGIAVDLPNAQLAVTPRSYLLHHPQLTSLWVRKMDKGVQIRMHVVKGVKLEAVVEDGGLRIRKE